MMKLVLLFFILVLTRGARAAFTEENRVHRIQLFTSAPDVSLEEFAREVSRRTDGQLMIDIVHGRPMSPQTLFIHLRSGKVQMAKMHTTFLGSINRDFWALDLPFLFEDTNHAARILDGEIGAKILANLSPGGVEGLAFDYGGGGLILSAPAKSILRPEDLRGLKIKLNDNGPVGAAFMRSLGAEPIGTVDEESPTLDAFEINYKSLSELPSRALRRNARVLNDLGHGLYLSALLINKEVLDSLPNKQQEVLREAARQIATRESRAPPPRGASEVRIGAAEKLRLKNMSRAVYTKFAPVFGSELIHQIAPSADLATASPAPARELRVLLLGASDGGLLDGGRKGRFFASRLQAYLESFSQRKVRVLEETFAFRNPRDAWRASREAIQKHQPDHVLLILNGPGTALIAGASDVWRDQKVMSELAQAFPATALQLGLIHFSRRAADHLNKNREILHAFTQFCAQLNEDSRAQGAKFKLVWTGPGISREEWSKKAEGTPAILQFVYDALKEKTGIRKREVFDELRAAKVPLLSDFPLSFPNKFGIQQNPGATADHFAETLAVYFVTHEL